MPSGSVSRHSVSVLVVVKGAGVVAAVVAVVSEGVSEAGNEINIMACLMFTRSGRH